MKLSSTRILLVLAVILLGANLVFQSGLVSPASAAAPPQVQDVIRAKLIELVAPEADADLRLAVTRENEIDGATGGRTNQKRRKPD